MVYQLKATDRFGKHCFDNPHLMEMTLKLLDFYDHVRSECGEVDYPGFAQDAAELLHEASEADISYALWQVGMNRDFKV